MRTVDEYLARIPPANRSEPKFAAMMAGLLAPIVAAGNVAESLTAAFDVDTAIGVQLDTVGVLVGVGRTVAVPLANVYFSFDVPGLGFDQGIIKGPYDDERGISVLDNDTYRKLIKAKILSNAWDGSVVGATAILNAFFDDPDTHVFAEDGGTAIVPGPWFAFDTPGLGLDEGIWFKDEDVAVGRMTMQVCLAGKIPNALLLALLGGGYLPVKPAGVSLEYLITSVDDAPLFGFDVDNEFIGGFDRGAIGVSTTDAAALAE